MLVRISAWIGSLFTLNDSATLARLMLLLKDGHHGRWDELCRNSTEVSSSCEIVAFFLQLCFLRFSYKPDHDTMVMELCNVSTKKCTIYSVWWVKMTSFPFVPSWPHKGQLWPVEGTLFLDQCRPPLTSSLSVPVRGPEVFAAVSGLDTCLLPFLFSIFASNPFPFIPASRSPLSSCIAFCTDSCDLASFVVNLWHCDSCHPESVNHKDPGWCSCMLALSLVAMISNRVKDSGLHASTFNHTKSHW